MNLDVPLCESIARICGVPADQVSPDSTLEDLGIDSLAAAEIITDVEIRTGAELQMDVLGSDANRHLGSERGEHRALDRHDGRAELHATFDDLRREDVHRRASDEARDE